MKSLLIEIVDNSNVDGASILDRTASAVSHLASTVYGAATHITSQATGGASQLVCYWILGVILFSAENRCLEWKSQV